MKYRFSVLFALAIAAALGSLATVQTQQVVVQSAILQEQPNPPGSPGTTQSPWIQTATGGAQANNVTQPASPGKTNYCTGFEVTGSGATGASTIAITLQSGGTTIANYSFTVIAGATLADQNPLLVEFATPVSGLGPGQTMVLNVPSFGAGNTAASVTMHGFTQ